MDYNETEHVEEVACVVREGGGEGVGVMIWLISPQA